MEFERYVLADADPDLKRYLNGAGDDHENCE
jgi:hypothetical protein